MKKIGHGWQYTTYDLGNGRVYKKSHSWIRAFFVIASEIFPFDDDRLWQVPGFISGLRKFAKSSRSLLAERSLAGDLIANAEFVDGLHYEQDMVISIKQSLVDLDVSSQKKIINKFVQFAKSMFDDYGIIDNSFNIANNYGINESGAIVLIDIGELQGDPEKIKEQINDRQWARHYITMHLPKGEIQEYFIQMMDLVFIKR